MTETVGEMLAREAREAEEVAEGEERGEVQPKPGQRARQSGEPSQVYSLRLPTDAIDRLRVVAERLDEAPTALLRRWVLERLGHEATRQSASVDPVSEAVEGLLPLVRQRLVEAAHEHIAVADRMPKAPPHRDEVNLGPSRRALARMQPRRGVSA